MEPNYRERLKEEFENRRRRNARYSLRAFARDIQISPSRLSEVLSGRHGLSRSSAAIITKRLGYSKDEAEHFCDLVEAEHARSEDRRELARIRLEKHKHDPQLKQIKMDTFKLISDWYHFAIIEMTKLKSFKSSPEWIARKLEIKKSEAEQAIERLLRLGLLTKTGNKLTGNPISISSDIPSKAIRDAHRDILKKAGLALDIQPVPDRIFSSSMMAVPAGAVDRVREMIDEFRTEFYREMLKSEDRQDLYCLGVQFFRLDAGD